MDEKAGGISASEKILDILLLFRGGQPHISIDDISTSLDIPRSTVYRHVRILSERGFLERTGAGHYRLGLTFLELSRLERSSNRDIRLIALPSMKRIAESISESVSLMRIFHRQVICIESIEGRHALRVSIEPGRTQPMHAGASSKLLLAHIPESGWENTLDFPLTRFTDATITDFDELSAHLRVIREQGYSVSNGEIDAGARAVAVPLKNGHGEVVAALSIEAPESRMDEAAVMRYVTLLWQEAETILQELT